MSKDTKNTAMHLIDNAAFNCKRCLLDNKTNTVKQYYVNLDTTMTMCCICKGSYLKENEVTVHQPTQKSLTAGSLKKLSLLPFLLKEEPDASFTQEEARQILETAHRSYRKARTREDAKLNEFLSLIGQLLPNQVKNVPDLDPHPVATADPLASDLEDSNDEVFYFSNGLALPKSEVTDEDIEAAISALSCGGSPAIKYEDLTDIDSLLNYSADLEQSIPILSDETLLSPIYLDKIDESLRILNDNESGIRVNVDFNALQKLLRAPETAAPRKSDERRKKKIGRVLAKSVVRPCDLVRRNQQLHEWKEKTGKLSLTQRTQRLNKIAATAKQEIANSIDLKPDKDTKKSSNPCLAISSFKEDKDSTFGFSSRNRDLDYRFEPNMIACPDSRKMFKGFEFKEFQPPPITNELEVCKKPSRKYDLKKKSPAMILYEKLRERKRTGI